MAYDAALAVRVRTRLARAPGLAERSMFGGLCFLVNGHMCAGIVGDTLMLRVGPERYAEALARPHAREMDFTGKALRGFVYVAPAGFESDDDLLRWVKRCEMFVSSLPPK